MYISATQVEIDKILIEPRKPKCIYFPILKMYVYIYTYMECGLNI